MSSIFFGCVSQCDGVPQIRLARPELHNRRLRLILSGQLLADNTQLYARIASLEQRRRKPSNTSGSSDEAEVEDPNAPAPPTWIHCSVGPQLKEGEEEDSRVQVRASDGPCAVVVLSSEAGSKLTEAARVADRATEAIARV